MRAWTKRELIDALEAHPAPDTTEVTVDNYLWGVGLNGDDPDASTYCTLMGDM